MHFTYDDGGHMLRELMNKINEINNTMHEANIKLYKLWLSDMLFTWHWWLGFALSVGLWCVWFKYRKKESTYRLLFAGTISALLSVLLDDIGMAMGLWGYTSKVIPLVPPVLPWDLCLVPVLVMFTLQIKPKANPLLKGVILAMIGSFILQPIFAWIGIYNPKGWRHWYSVPFAIAIYLISHFAATRKQFEKI